MKCIAFLLLFCLPFWATAQLQLGIKAGYQRGGAVYKRMGERISATGVSGFAAGLASKVYFDDQVAFASGLQFNGRGFAVKTLPGDTLRSYHLYYLDIPLQVHIDFSKQRRGFYARVGPVISIGLYGNEKYMGANGASISRKAILSTTGNHFGLFDASLQLTLGYAFTKKCFVEAGYAHGIGNINNDPLGPNIKSRVYGISVGYWFR
jgi:hypothetical protein